MKEVVFLVKGSSSDPYKVIFIKDGDSLTAICSCPAGQFGNVCKHRIAILDGDGSAVSSDNAASVSEVVSWLAGTDVESALAELRLLENATAANKNELHVAKKKLAKAMNT